MFEKDKRPLVAVLALLALVGCAGGMEKPVTEPVRPASSVSVPTSEPATTLRPDALDAPAATSVADAQRSAEMGEAMKGASGGHEGHGSHGGSTYVHLDAGRQTEAQEASHDHDMGEMAAVYVCPMHPEVTSTSPGKCTKCGMALVQRRKK